MFKYVIISSVSVSLTLPINSCTLCINIIMQHMIYGKKIHMLLSDSQLCNRWAQNMPYFVIMPGFTTHYKSWCDMSAPYSSEISYAKISFSSNYNSIITPVIHVVHKITWYNKYHQTRKCKPGKYFISLLPFCPCKLHTTNLFVHTVCISLNSTKKKILLYNACYMQEKMCIFLNDSQFCNR